MSDRQTQLEMDVLRREFNSSLLSVQNTVSQVQASVDSLVNTVTGLSTLSYAEINNLLDNSFPEWSDAAYTTFGVSPSTVSDANREAYNWFRQLSTDTTLAQGAANALKASGHTLYAANEGTDADIPIWTLPEGHIAIGGVTDLYDLVYLLPNELVYPGLVFYVQFEAMLASGTLPDIQFFAEFWDNTAGQRKVIEGGNFTIIGEIFGTPGTRSVEYQVLARTDSGEEAISNTLAFANAPGTFTQNNHPRINFRGAPGYIEFEIYRKEVASSTFVLQYVVRNSIEGTYFDVGNEPIRPVAAFPAASATPPKAYAKTRTFRPGAADFVRHTLTIQVPTTYDSSLTGAGMQWLRLGLTGATAVERQVLIRKIGLSLGDGGWSRSSYDNQQGAHSTRTAVASSAPSGDSGGGVEDPPPFGSGRHCVLMDSLVHVIGDTKKQITLRELQARCQSETLYCYGAGATSGRVRCVKTAYASRILHIKTKTSAISCTFDHPFILSQTDIYGTPAGGLKVGDYVQIFNKAVISERILAIEPEYGDFTVGIPMLEGNHICILNGFVSHNKEQFDPNA